MNYIKKYKHHKNILFFFAIGLLVLWLLFTLIFFLGLNKILLLIIPRALFVLISGDGFIQFHNIDWWHIFLALIGAATYIIVGLPLVTVFTQERVFTKISLSFILGLGATTIILELFGIFYLLSQSIILASFIVLGIGSWYLSTKKRKKIRELQLDNIELESDIPVPAARWQKVYYRICFGIITLITILTFYHALLYPETYWDSLIYYLHYGKMIYQQHGFPTLICAQVGLGLGANYPHLYPLIGGTLSILFGGYSDLFGQFVAPFAGLLATILIYYLIITFCSHFSKQQAKLAAISTALLFRSVPFGIAYFTYASDYSIVMLFTAGFLYTSLLYLKTTKSGYLWLSGLIAAFQTQVNYLGWIFFPLLLLLILFEKQKNSRAAIILFVSFLVALPWYIRNWLITGNPVYVFFPQIFGGKHINPEVLASCYHEWAANGIGVPGATVWERIIHTPQFFFFDWRFAPALLGFAVPGIVLIWFKSTLPNKRVEKRFLYLVLFLFLFGFFYHLVVSSLYLYQIVFIIPAIAVLSGYFICSIVKVETVQPMLFKGLKQIKGIIFVLVLLVGLVPGLSMSIMGHKYANPNLIAFRYPGMQKMQFMQLVYGDAVSMWEWINQNLHNTKLLTHDNRYHMYNDDIKIVHLDDWDIQPLYNISDSIEKLRIFKRMEIAYYLFIPNERNHPIVQKLGIQKLIAEGYLKLIYQSGENQLYQFDYAQMGKN